MKYLNIEKYLSGVAIACSMFFGTPVVAKDYDKECVHAPQNKIILSDHKVYRPKIGIRGVSRIEPWEDSDIREKGTGNVEVYFTISNRKVPITSRPYVLKKGDCMWGISREKLSHFYCRTPTNKEIGQYVEDIKTSSGITSSGNVLEKDAVIFTPDYPTNELK